MKLVLISDTHANHNKIQIPECDILIHSGDFSDVGDRYQVEDFLFWLTIQPAKHKIYIAGNHDMKYESHPHFKREMIINYPKVNYLEDSGILLEGLNIYGSPWQPRFFDWGFNLDRGKPLADKWAKIPEDTNILITHGPPYGFGDQTKSYENVGCWDLLYRINNLPNLKLHVFGHIHPGYGIYKNKNTILVNAALCNDWNRVRNKPIEIEL